MGGDQYQYLGGHEVQVEALEGSSWLAHRGTGTRVALNVTANSQWKEVHQDAMAEMIICFKSTLMLGLSEYQFHQKVKVEKKSGLRLLFFDLPLLKPS